MSRRRSKPGRHRLDPIEVIEGRTPVSLDELFRLVHEVNPTGQALSEPERKRRYAFKARLQSLLVLRFADHVEAVADPQNPAVVSIQRRGLAGDACHAILDELEPEARSLVRRQLDERAHSVETPVPATSRGRGTPAPPERPDEPGDNAEQLVRQATHALEAFDFETAQDRLHAALALSGGASSAALPLVELLVDHLGADGEALDVERRLSPEAAAHPGVRAKLALAAARLSQSDRALRLLKGLAPTASTDAWAALARASLREQDEHAAEHWIRQLREHVPAHPDLPRLARDVEASRASRMGPLEASLERDFAAGQVDRIEDRARAILAEWPESAVARRVLRESSERRRRQECEEAIESARRALLAGDLAGARRSLERAASLGGSDEDLLRRLDQAEEEARGRADADRVAAVLGGLRGPTRREAMLAYLSLPPPLRRRVREGEELALLESLDQLAPPHSAVRPEAAVDAVLAFEDAERLLAAGDPQAALARLAGHEKELRHLHQVRELTSRAEREAAQARGSHAAALLAAAEEAAGRSAPEEATRLLAACERRVLSATDQARAEALSARLDEAVSTRQLEARWNVARAAGDLLAAREAASLILKRASAEEAARWQAELEGLRAAIRQQWRQRTFDNPGPDLDLRDVTPSHFTEDAAVWLTEDGAHLVLCDAHGPWVFVRVVDLAAERVVRALAMRAPESLGSHLGHAVDGETLWVVGERGHFLRLSMGDWEVVQFRSLREILPEGLLLERAVPLPGSAFLWAHSRIPNEGNNLCVVDIDAWRVRRQVSGEGWICPVLGAQAPQMVCPRLLEPGARLHSATGRPVGDLPVRRWVLGSAVHPGGSGLLLLVGEEGGEEPGDDLALLEVGDAGCGQLLTLPEGHPDTAHTVATALRDRLAYALVSSFDSGRTLVAVRATRAGLRRAYSRSVADTALLVQDARSQRVALLQPTPRGIEGVLLGARPPEEGQSDLVEDRAVLPSVNPPFICGWPAGAPRTKSHVLVVELERRDPRERRDFVRSYRHRHESDPQELLALLLALRQIPGEHETAEGLSSWLAERFPDDPATVLIRAGGCAETRQWAELRRIVGAADLRRLDDGTAQHLHHLLGIARLHAGDRQGALAAWRAGMRRLGACQLEECLPLAIPLPARLQPKHWGPGQPVVRQLMGAVHVADQALARGDVEGALAAIDRPVVWRASELQSSARLAEAHLRSVRASSWFHAALALARFLSLHAGDSFSRWRELPFPEATWEPSRLDELSRRCSAWLERAPAQGD